MVRGTWKCRLTATSISFGTRNTQYRSPLFFQTRRIRAHGPRGVTYTEWHKRTSMLQCNARVTGLTSLASTKISLHTLVYTRRRDEGISSARQRGIERMTSSSYSPSEILSKGQWCAHTRYAIVCVMLQFECRVCKNYS